MFINKIGQSHLDYGINNQDSGFDDNNLKCVVDGCSEGKHSEVGAKLFCYDFKKFKNMFDSFSRIVFFVRDIDIIDYMLFTVLISIEHEDYFEVFTCGDGYILLLDKNNKLEIRKLDKGDIDGYPIYYAYKFINEKYLDKITYEDIKFERYIFSKRDYKKAGVATDGLRYIFGTEFEELFKQCLIEDKEIQIKRLINKYQNTFKDDITISF